MLTERIAWLAGPHGLRPAAQPAAVLLALLVCLWGPVPGASAQPAATTWVLQKGQNIPSRLARKPRLLMEGQKLSGSTGCNSFTATVSDKGDKRIAIERVALTRMLCAPAQNKIERAFVQALGQTEFLEQKGQRLTFLSGKRQPLLVWTRNGKSATKRRPARRTHYARAHRPAPVWKACPLWWK